MRGPIRYTDLIKSSHRLVQQEGAARADQHRRPLRQVMVLGPPLRALSGGQGR